MNLTKEDYLIILNHYGVAIPYTKKGKPSLRKMKKRVNALLAGKLCRCIKSVEKYRKRKKYSKNFPAAVCNKSIFKNRGMKHYRFTCKKKHILFPKKGAAVVLSKTRKGKLKFKPKRKSRRKK